MTNGDPKQNIHLIGPVILMMFSDVITKLLVYSAYFRISCTNNWRDLIL